MVGQIQTDEIKVGELEKRSQFKTFWTQENYQTRVFVLDSASLKYFTGTVQNREEEKGCIELGTVLAVETVQEGRLEGKENAFQVTYTYVIDGSPMTLYIVAPNQSIRDSWISAIRTAAQRNGATFAQYYHGGILLVDGTYNCCGREKNQDGCLQTMQPSTVPGHHTPSAMSVSSIGSHQAIRLSNLLVDTMMKRAQGKGAFFTKENFKKRTFVLDANSLRYYDGDMRLSEYSFRSEEELRKNERGRIHLSCVVTVEPAELPERYDNVFQVAYFDDYSLLRLYIVGNSKDHQDKWIKAIKREAIKAGAEFLPTYHPGLFSKAKGKWLCCEDMNRLNEGCRRIIAQPDMKMCSADLNTSVATSNRLQSPAICKVACFWKKSQNKSTFFSFNNYQKRVFTLDNYALAYYSGYLEDRGELKCSIPYVEMLVVENVKDGFLEDKVNVFQVVYLEDKKVCNLYIVAESDAQRLSWVTAIKKEALRSNVSLLPRYHTGVYIKSFGYYNCCQRKGRDIQGCSEIVGMSLQSVRERLNTMDSMTGPRHRLGTLDSVPEHAIMIIDKKRTPIPTPQHSAHRHRQQRQQQQQQQPLTEIHQENKNQPQVKHTQQNENQNQQRKLSTDNSHDLQDDQWKMGVTTLAMSAAGIKPVQSGKLTNGSASSKRDGIEGSANNSRQISDLSNAYSEDFETLSDIDM